MESLGELLKSIPKGNQILEQAQRKFKELQQDELVTAFREKNPTLTDETIKLNLNRVHQYVTEYRNCSRCPGLENCPNDFQGHYTMLNVEEVNGLQQLIDKKVSCKKNRAHQHEQTLRKRIRSFHIDDKVWQRVYSAQDILEVDKDRQVASAQVISYVNDVIENGISTQGLYLSGDFGVGKTYLMCYMLQELAKQGVSGVIVYMPEFIEDIKMLMHDAEKLKETVELMKHTDVLVFDDIGAENLSPWIRDHVIGAILNYRMERKPTFYTSNYRLADLESHFSFTNKEGEEHHKGKRLMNRVAPYVKEIVLHGKNKRGLSNH